MPSWLALSITTVVGGITGYFLANAPDDDPFARDTRTATASRPAPAWLDELLEGLDVGVITVDARDRVTLANSASARLFFTTTARMQGRALIEATSSAELDRRIFASRSAGRSRNSLQYITSRSTHIFDVSTIPLSDGTIVIIIVDITAQRENERIRREFLGNVSHELRTPLAGIKLMFETLEAVDTADARSHFYPQIHSEIDRLVEIVEHLLDVARAEGGRLQLRTEPLALHDILNTVLGPFEGRIRQGAVTLEVAFAPVYIEGDRGRIAQIFTNLLENALRHTSPGGSISVSSHQVGNRAILTVADTGSGIPFKDVPHIFERFYVVERSRAKVSGGLGLGLALVKASVEAHNGTIEVESEFGVGSTFRVSFPSIPPLP